MTSARARLNDDDSQREKQHTPSEPPSGLAPRSEPPTRARGLGVILIVDDTADTREMYSLYFRANGFTVLTADDGEAGLNAAATQRPDVIVMDVSMPRMDGITAIRRLKADQRSRSIPVILLTGYPERAIREGGLEAGAAAFLTKPCLPEDLEANVRRVLEGAAPK